MKEQIILTIGREFGSGGHEIAGKLADHYQLSLYDDNLLKEVAVEKNIKSEALEQFDETKKKIGIYRTVRGIDSSPEYNVAQMQFDFLKKKAAAGESFVVVGRCAESVLKEYSAVISIFILGDRAKKLERISNIYKTTMEQAARLLMDMDNKRKKYYNSYCEGKWGDSRNYDISVNSSKQGIDGTVSFLINYIDARRAQV